jgi:hypothetical protein
VAWELGTERRDMGRHGPWAMGPRSWVWVGLGRLKKKKAIRFNCDTIQLFKKAIALLPSLFTNLLTNYVQQQQDDELFRATTDRPRPCAGNAR